MAIPAIVAAAIAKAAGPIVGEAFSTRHRNKGSHAWDEAYNRSKGQMALDPQKALAFLGLTNRSAVEDLDPLAREQSMEATKRLLDRGAGTGLDIQGKTALAEANRQAGGQARAARQAILQEYANRGQVGSGGQMLGDLMGSQAAFEGAAASGGQAAAAAEQRRLEANLLAGRQAQGQQGVDQAKAAAIDTLRRFNVGAKQGVISGETAANQQLTNTVKGFGDYQQVQADKDRRAGSTYGNSVGGAIQSIWGANQ